MKLRSGNAIENNFNLQRSATQHVGPYGAGPVPGIPGDDIRTAGRQTLGARRHEEFAGCIVPLIKRRHGYPLAFTHQTIASVGHGRTWRRLIP